MRAEIRNAAAVGQLHTEAEKPVRQLLGAHPACVLLVKHPARLPGRETAGVRNHIKRDTRREGERVRNRDRTALRPSEHEPQRNGNAELAFGWSDPRRTLVLDGRVERLVSLFVCREEVVERHSSSLCASPESGARVSLEYDAASPAGPATPRLRPLTAAREQSTAPAQLERRRRATAEAWGLERGQAVVIGAGTPISVPGRADRTYPFLSHSEYLYLTDRERPGAVLAFDPGDGWSDFVPGPTTEELLWSGAPAAEPGVSTEALAGWLHVRKGARIANLGAPVPGAESDAALEVELRSALNRIRRVKDELELERMREAERATRAGFAVVAELIAPGRSERELQIEIESTFLRNGADSVAYETIVAGGPNSAVLHFPPTSRVFADGDLVLIDAGAEVRGYASDVTRTYPASGAFTPEQQALHAVVAAACTAAIESCAPGVEWLDVHATAAGVIAEGLVDLGLLRGARDTLVESGAVTLFFPHGIGHMVGLGIRDAGEVLPGRSGTRPGLPQVRVDLPLEPGHCFTVEPGIYFVPALLQDAERRRTHADSVDWERVDGMLGFGGIRIEHNVLVTENGVELLTADVPLLG